MQGYFSWLRNSMPFNDGFSEAWNGQCFVKWWVVLIAQRYFSAIYDEYTLMCLLIETWNTDVINWFYSFHFKLQNPVSPLLLAHFDWRLFYKKVVYSLNWYYFNILFQQISFKLSIIQNTLQKLSVIFMLHKEKKDNF